MIMVQTDGATNQKTGKSGVGIYMKAGDTYESFSLPITPMSNHEAEFRALLEALIICNEKYPNEIIACQTDSAIVVDSVEKGHTKNEDFKSMLEEILTLSAKHPHFFIKWIPSNQNTQADKLAKQAIHKT